VIAVQSPTQHAVTLHQRCACSFQLAIHHTYVIATQRSPSCCCWRVCSVMTCSSHHSSIHLSLSVSCSDHTAHADNTQSIESLYFQQARYRT